MPAYSQSLAKDGEEVADILAADAMATLAAGPPNDVTGQHNLASSHELYAEALLLAAHWQEALEQLDAALAIDAKLAEHSPENGEYTHSSATYHMDMGEARLHLGQLTEAERDIEKAQSLFDTVAARDPGNHGFETEQIKTFGLHGDIAAARGQPEQARLWYERALAAARGVRARNVTLDGDAEQTASLEQRLRALPSPPDAAPAGTATPD